MSDYFTMGVSVFLVPKRDDQILLQLRRGTNYADGLYGLVGGHIDGQERATDAMIREAQEETGILIAPDDLHFSCVMHRRASSDREFVAFFYTCDAWQNEICNKELDYCEELRFFPVEQLPENTIPWVRGAVEHILAKQPYYEQGWDER